VPTGRRDGKVSNLRDADVLPDVHDSAQVLRSKFAASGLDDKDLVLLSCKQKCKTNRTKPIRPWWLIQLKQAF
jgi:hypothetical protein